MAVRGWVQLIEHFCRDIGDQVPERFPDFEEGTRQCVLVNGCFLMTDQDGLGRCPVQMVKGYFSAGQFCSHVNIYIPAMERVLVILKFPLN